MKTTSTILFASLFIILIIQNTKAQNWEFVGLDSMVIYGLEVKGDTIWAGTRDFSINDNSGLYKSIDQGQTWEKLDSSLGNKTVTLFSIDKNNSSKIYVIKGYNDAGYFYKTHNDGLSWDSIGTPGYAQIKDFIISPIDPNEYYVITHSHGFPWPVVDLFYKSTDSGNIWEYKCCQSMPIYGLLLTFAIDHSNPDKLFISGYSNYEFFKGSTDRGDSWQDLSYPTLSKVFVDNFLPNRIYLFGYQQNIFSNDGGVTWHNMGGEYSLDAVFISYYQDEMTSVLYALTDEGVYYSNNELLFWRLISGSENLPVIQPINYSSTIRNISTNNNFIYTGSASGIYRTDFVTEVNEQSYHEQPTELYLAQNYPNPFNTSTKIEFSLPNKSIIQLNVFNLLGQKVAELANGNYDAGNYSFLFNAGNLPSGVYFYQLIADNFNKMKKMQFLK